MERRTLHRDSAKKWIARRRHALPQSRDNEGVRHERPDLFSVPHARVGGDAPLAGGTTTVTISATIYVVDERSSSSRRRGRANGQLELRLG